MKSRILPVVALTALFTLPLATSASADSWRHNNGWHGGNHGSHISLSFGLPLFRPAPVYYNPPPVYYAPPAYSYYAPRPVYYSYSRPVYYGPSYYHYRYR